MFLVPFLLIASYFWFPSASALVLIFIFFFWAAYYTIYFSKCSFGGIQLCWRQRTNETCRWTVIFMVTTNAPVYMYLNTYMKIRNCRKLSVKIYNFRKFQQAIANKTLGWPSSHTEYFTCSFSIKIMLFFNHFFYKPDYAHFENQFGLSCCSYPLNIVEFDLRLLIYSA